MSKPSMRLTRIRLKRATVVKHQVITLPEHHKLYPRLWQSDFGAGL
ncbi:hypothetical protein OAD40_00490 [bacterium]|nr:hypothetical protein [bacterium]